MKAEKIKQPETVSRVHHSAEITNALQMKDNREMALLQAKMKDTIQRQEVGEEDEDDLFQGKMLEPIQRQEVGDEEEEDLFQAKMAEPIQRDELDDEDDLIQGKFENKTGMPDGIKQRMEDSFGMDFSSVRIHPDSPSAPEVGALAYTQGTDIHFAPGQFKPDTSAGRQLLGHELTHVVQQSQGLVQPTGEVGGMPVNDNETLEHEADIQGFKVS